MYEVYTVVPPTTPPQQVIGDRRLEVRRAADNAVTALLTHPLRVTALAFLPPPLPPSDAADATDADATQHVLTACDDGRLRVVDGASGDLLSETPTVPHCGRVKEAVLLPATDGAGEEGRRRRERRVVTASSDGRVVVWAVGAEGTGVVPGAVGSLGEGVRITCLAAYAPAGGGDAAAAAASGVVGAGVREGEQANKKKRKHKHGGKGGAGVASPAPRETAGAGGGGKKRKGPPGPGPAVGRAQKSPQQQQQSSSKKQKQKEGQKPQHGSAHGWKEAAEGRSHKKGFQKQQQHQQQKKQGGGGGRTKTAGGVVSFL